MFARMGMGILALLWTTTLTAGSDLTPFSTPARVADEVLITFAPDVGPAEQEELLAERGAVIVRRYRSVNGVLARMTESPLFLQSVSLLAEDNRIRRVAPNRLIHLLGRPDDPRRTNQYQHDLIEAEKAWDIATGSRDVVVAVIDSGIALDHEDLADNIWTNPGESGKDAAGRDKRSNGVDDDGNGYVDDYRGWDFVGDDNDPTDGMGHGTHCAGTIGAAGDNGVGIAGINWQVSLVALRIFDDRGRPAEEGDVLAALEYANTMKFPIVSNSWGGAAEPETEFGAGTGDLMYEMIRKGEENGALWVFASGNAGTNNDATPVLPAGYDLDHIIAVGASTSRDALAGFSNYGARTVDLMAPGDRIYSTNVRSLFGGGYARMSGTSMAAPVVTGAAALLLSTDPTLSGLEIKAQLIRTVDPVRSVRGKLLSGGRLNLYRALTE